MRKLNITDKLSFEGNPVLVVKDLEIEVNADAATVFRIMEVVGGSGITTKDVMTVYDMLFSESEREKIDSLKLSFPDFTQLVNSAIELVTGAEDNAGEAEIPATI